MRRILLPLIGLVVCLAMVADAAPVPVGSISADQRGFDWEGVSGVDPATPCATAIDPACDHVYILVVDAMSDVLIGAVREDCEDPAPGCESFTIHVFATDLAHTPLASGTQTASVQNIAAGTTLEVQVVGPAGGAVGLTPYLGFARGCPAAQYCLPTTGR